MARESPRRQWEQSRLELPPESSLLGLHTRLISPFYSTLLQKHDFSNVKESTSFVSNIFKGKIVMKDVFPFPLVLSEEQTSFLKTHYNSCQGFFEKVNNMTWNDEHEKIGAETLKGLKGLKLFGLQVPEEQGGLGLTNTQFTRLVEIFGWHDLAVAVTLGAHQANGFRGILLFGNKYQKERYIPDLASGKSLAAFCLTESTGGSNTDSIMTTAEVSECGKFYTLNGRKIWISNGGIAEIFTVFAKTQVKDMTTGEVHGKISAFIVEKDFGGVTSGPPQKKMGIKASNTTEVHFNNVRVPAENLLGDFGDGYKIAMNILNSGRFAVVCALVGTIRKLIIKATNFAATREQSGTCISNHGIIQKKLARMVMYHYVTESMAYMISGNLDKHVSDLHLEVAICKIFASEAAWEVIDECIQVLGGIGYMKAGGVEQIMRDLRIFRILQGTNDVLRVFVALGGLQHAGAQLKDLQFILENPMDNTSVLFTELGLRARRTIGLPTGISLEGVVSAHLVDTASLVTKCVDLFSEAIEILLIRFGTEVNHRQFHLKKIADTAIDIYSMGVVLSRTTHSLNHNLNSAEHEKLLCESWCHEAFERVLWNLRTMKCSSWSLHYQNLKAISDEVVKNRDVLYSPPVSF
ncbi:very long-chain specific acyl-CoA dehydrogenase, mitochondrial-like isoform X3 [Monodelphis domestica]|uniref:very long-chain specific acyl-CoA dehydrogenase, mitochondrial-like isoform X3 n=1 Tax=Monodelphis domestica TaxID=13616 RepID=UPI0024E2258A|nr:very long-chain specific acyl-CoA dehydrogenase, mitochondrial-like isoform X3 [Monodelphis domestica]